MRKHYCIIFITIILIIYNIGVLHAASLNPGVFNDNLVISAPTELNGGTYQVQGDFIVTSTLTIKTNTVIRVQGNIEIKGTITSKLAKFDLYLVSTEGDIIIPGRIEINSAQGIQGSSGGIAEQGDAGGNGYSSNLYVVAESGNISIVGTIINKGGTGGTGGNGGRSTGTAFSGTSGGNGGKGGTGGKGGEVKIIAKKGWIKHSGAISSIGGTGGTGGTGGPDKTLWGGPGDGGNGGTGGDGGIITLVGQHLSINTPQTSRFTVSTGSGGAGGAGGTAGSYANNGDPGTRGSVGRVPGNITIHGGVVYTNMRAVKSISELPLTVTPTNASNFFKRDDVAPANPTNIQFPYSNLDGMIGFYPDDSVVIKFKVPASNGHEYTFANVTTTYASPIKYFEVYYETPTESKSLILDNSEEFIPGIYYEHTLSLPHNVNIKITKIETCDYYDLINTYTLNQSLIIDTIVPEVPQLTVELYDPSQKQLKLTWDTPSDLSGIVNYDVYINGTLEESKIRSNYCYYDGDYNSKYEVMVLARDKAGNISKTPLKPMVVIYTAPMETQIKRVIPGDVNNNYSIDVDFPSVGAYAEKYKLTYYEVGDDGRQIGLNLEKIVIDNTTPKDELIRYTLDNLGKHKKYTLFISTLNKDPENPLESELYRSPENPIQLKNTVPTKPVIIMPISGDRINKTEANNFAFIGSKSTDPDNDPLTYSFYVKSPNWSIYRKFSGSVMADNTVRLNSFLINGTYYCYLSVEDGYGGIAKSNIVSFTVDKEDPSIPTFTIPSFVNANRVTLSNIRGVDAVKLIVGPNADGKDNIINYTQTYELTFSDFEGDYTIYLRSIDRYGNMSDYARQVVRYDATPPLNPVLVARSDTRQILCSWGNGIDSNPINVINPSGVSKYQLAYRKIGATIWAESEYQTGNELVLNSYLTESFDDNSGYQVKIRTIDFADNMSEYSTPITIYTNPAIGEFAGFEQGYTYSNYRYEHYFDITITPGDFADFRILRSDVGSVSDWLDSSITTFRDQVEPHCSYQYRIETRNSSQTGTCLSEWYSVTVQNNPPTIPTNLEPSGLVNSTNPILTCKMVEDPDYADSVQYYLTVSRGDWIILPWQKIGTHPKYTIANQLLDGYTYTYRVGVDDGYSMALDEFGKLVPTIISEEGSFTLDTSAPQITLILPDDIKEKVEEGDFVCYATVTINAEDLNPFVPNGLCSGFKSLKYYWDDNLNEVYEIRSGDTVTAKPGIHTLCVISEDMLGNVSNPEKIELKVDIISPDITDINVYGTQIDGRLYTANSTRLPISFKAFDSESGISMAFYAITTNTQSVQWKQLSTGEGIEQHYDFFAPVSLEDESSYYLAIKVIDQVGNMTISFSDPFTVDVSSPLITFNDAEGVLRDKYYISNLNELAIQANIVDFGSGIAVERYGFSERRDELGILSWKDSMELLKDEGLVDGKEYYIVVEAVDQLNHRAVAYSPPIVFDSTVPVIDHVLVGDKDPFTDQFNPQWNNTYLKVSWKVFDQVSLKKIRYAVGTSANGTDVSCMWAENEQGWLELDEYPKEGFVLISDLNLRDGTYFVTLEVTNEIGLSAVKVSNSLKIDSSLSPTPIIKDDGIYTDQREIHFTVTFPNEELKEFDYYYSIIDNSTKDLITTVKLLSNPENLDDISITVKESDLLATCPGFQNGDMYYVVLSKNNGEFIPVCNSDGITLDWTFPLFDTLDDGEYFTSNNVSLSWEVAIDEESEIAEYYYKIGTSRYGDELTPDWIPAGTKTTIAISDLGFENQGVYYAMVKAVNGAKGERIIAGDGFVIDTTPPSTPEVLTPLNYVNVTDRLSASWNYNCNDNCSGIVAYYYDLLEVPDLSKADWKPVETVTGNPLLTSIELTDLQLQNGTTYYIAVKAVNGAGLESSNHSLGVTIDTEAPSVPVITDGGYATSDTTQLSVVFESDDDISGLYAFDYALGTLNDDDLIKDWNMIPRADVTDSGLSLQPGEEYYYSARAIDNAKNRTIIRRSDGILVDSEPPVIQNLQSEGEFSVRGDELFFAWECIASYAPVDYYEYCLTTDVGTMGEWKQHDQTQLLLKAMDEIGQATFADNTRYYLFVRAIDKAQKVSTIDSVSVLVDITPPSRPEIISSGEYQSQNLTLRWRCNNTGSPIDIYEYALGITRGGADVTNGWIETTETVVHINDLPLVHNTRYYLSVKAKNTAGQWSEVSSDSGFLVDLLPPEMIEITGPRGINASMSVAPIAFVANDGEVGIRAYRYTVIPLNLKNTLAVVNGEIIQLPDVDGIFPKAVEHQFEVLTNLDDGQYCVAIQVQNIFGMWSEIAYSNDLTVDKTIPEVSFSDLADELVTNDTQIKVKYTPSEVGYIYYKLRNPDYSNTPVNGYSERWVITTSEQTLQLSLPEEGTYCLYLYLEDRWGNKSVEIQQDVRRNSPPVVEVNPKERAVYQGRELLLDGSDISVFDSSPDQDNDGYNMVFEWNFGDGTPEIQTDDIWVSHQYSKVGDYTVTLTVIDDDQGYTVVEIPVRVTITFEGDLVFDETWDGIINLQGSITVPQGVKLTINPSSIIYLPQSTEIIIKGSIVCVGGGGKTVFTTSLDDDEYERDSIWRGLYLDPDSSGSIIDNVQIEFAERGLVLNQQNMTVQNSIFRMNQIGIHLANSNVVIANCWFTDNVYYGIKSERDSQAMVTNNHFIRNGVSPYYDWVNTVLSVEELNCKLGSSNQDQ